MDFIKISIDSNKREESGKNSGMAKYDILWKFQFLTDKVSFYSYKVFFCLFAAEMYFLK